MPSRCLLLPVLLLATLGAAAMNPLPADPDALFPPATAGGPRWSCAVGDLAGGPLLYARDAEVALIPASNQKLVTLAALLAHFGPQYAPALQLWADGPIARGTLRGNLRFSGRGAACFTARHQPGTLAEHQARLDQQVAALADLLRAHGIRRVQGRLLADHRGYTTLAGNPHYPSATPLQFHENTLDIVVQPPTFTTCPARVLAFRLDAVTGGPAQARSASGSDRLLLNLQQPSTDYWRLEAHDGDAYALAHLAAALADQGFAIAGDDLPLGERYLLAELPGQPLGELLPAMGTTSDNQRAETLYLHLGHALGGDANYATARAAVLTVLRRQGLALPSCVPADGSGLSRDNRLSAADALALLRFLRASPHWPVADAALPVAGAPGTLARRFATPELAGNLRAKTGTLDGVRALTGYLTTRSGRQLAFAFLANDLADPATFWTAAEATARRLAQE